MFIKTEFVQFEVEIDGAKFKLREDDPTKFMIGKIRTTGTDNKAEIDVNGIQDDFLNACLVGWDGITASETKQPVAFSKTNIKFIPAIVRSQLWGKFMERCSLSEEEKKS